MSGTPTAGELQKKAREDTTRYDPLEVAYARFDDIKLQLEECAKLHDPIFDEEEYCICLVIARDSLFKNVRRHKYYAFLYLPSPSPNQVVFLYNKKKQSFKRLWCLPRPEVMAWISQMSYVDKQWESTKRWCDSFFNFTFWEDIRKEHGISMLSEKEYLELNREKLIQAGVNDAGKLPADPFDFSKIKINKVIDTNEVISDKNRLDPLRETKHLDGDIST